MRILLLTQWFDPEPSFKGLAFARELRALGHDVEVLTAFPNYPGGVIYPGYTLRWRQEERLEGFRIRRVWVYPSHDRNPIRRIISYGSFALTALLGGLRGMQRPDVIYAYHPPMTIGIPAVALGWWWGVPFVLDVQDLWPDTVATSGMMSSRPVLAVLSAFCNFVYRRAAHIAVLSQGFRRTLIGRGVPEHKVSVIRNWADEGRLAFAPPDPAFKTTLGFDGRLVVLFAGTMGAGQALDVILDAARLARSRVPAALFVFVGDGTARAELEREAATLDNVRFLPRQPLDAMGPILAMSDLLLVSLRDDALFRITIPSKTQAYLASGRPILMCVAGEAAEIVDEARAGMVVPPGSADAIVHALERFSALSEGERAELGANGKHYYDTHLSLRQGVATFGALFKQVVEQS
ncbi:MAG: glycosyltransferase family 4 protein [bacterium]